MNRHEMGFNLQGLDYTYTLQGWLKAINHSTLDLNDDPGGDDGSTNGFVEDVFGMVLNYHEDDFKRSGSPFNSHPTNIRYLEGGNLYNGNIKSWQQQIRASGVPGLLYEQLYGHTYRYDQLNRLKGTHYHMLDGATWSHYGTYDEEFTYDRNGNIQTTTRWGDDNGAQVIDEFLYDYQTHNNQLNRVDDNTAILAWIVPLPVFP